MKRLEKLEKAGYKVTTDINTGNVFIKKGNGFLRKYSSITQAHKNIFGY